MEDRRILEQFPLLLARGYRRYLNAPESKERHDHGYFLFEIYLKYVSATAIAAYLASPERDHRVNAALKGLLRPSLGEWLRFLRECLEHAGRREDSDPVIRSIAALFKERDARSPRCLQLFNQMRSFRTGERSEKEAIHLGGLLDEVVAFRNRALGHGAPLDREHYRAFGDLFGPAFAELLDRSPFLTARRLVSFDSTRVEEGSWVECGVIEFMGNQPVRRQRPHRIRYGESVPAENLLYLLSDGALGEGAGLLVLDPLLVAHREDVYILNEAQGAPEYLSYSTGEHHRPSDLGGKQGELFEKILGYRVDETRMSQMGDELASSAEEAASLDSKDGEKRLGDYRIVREVGRGAMGTVFEAFQESLGRRVALKVLPGTFALDQRRLERFRREARATARIHHPNIVPVYEVGEADGNHFYSMEFVDGESLDRRLAGMRERSPPGQRARSSGASDAAAITGVVEQIAALAEGLEEAHRLGLVHRDVKPSNILVDRSGRYVLVDFGLVREVEAETLTRSGEMVGTLVYMSPEQVSRRPVDARSDIYSLGVTLYEILTLRAPFGGSSDHEIQNAILFQESAPLRKINPRIHRDLETIVLHAMEKNPESRYTSAGALAKDLRRFLRYEPIQARPQTAARRLLRRGWKHRGKVVSGAAILFLVAVAGVFAWKASRPPHYLLVNQRPLTTDLDSFTTEPAFSRDGKLLAYASDRGGKGNLDLWVEEVPGGTARQLTSHDADDREPDFSPDGTRIVFRSDRGRGGIYLVPTAGGEEVLIAEQGRGPRFSPEGSRIAYWVGPSTVQGMLFVSSISGGPPTRLCPEFISACSPVWLADGRELLFLGWPGISFDNRQLCLVGIVDSHPARLLGDSALHPGSWMPERGVLLLSTETAFQNTGALWAGRIQGPPWQLRGSPQMLTAAAGFHGWPAAAGTGQIAFASLSANKNLYMAPLDADRGKAAGKLERLTASTSSFFNPSLSADGKKACFTAPGPEGLRAQVMDLEHGKKVFWSSPGGVWSFATISPKGSKVAYVERRESGHGEPQSVVFVTDLAQGTTRKVCDVGYVMSWSSDEGAILAARNSDDRRGFVTCIEVATGDQTTCLEHPRSSAYRPRFSPDDRWIAFNVVSERTRSQVFVAPFRGKVRIDPGEWIPITDGSSWADKACWSPDGDLLYFISDRDGWRCIYAQRLDPQTKRPLPESAVEVLPIHGARLSARNIDIQDFDFAVAGGKLVINLGELTGNLWLAELEEE